MSTIFAYPHSPSLLIPASALPQTSSSPTPPSNPHDHIYSRTSSSTSTRLEAILSSLLSAPAITYASGLSALHALYLALLPRKVAIGGGYHGTHAVLALHRRITARAGGGVDQLQILDLDCPPSDLGPGDVIHLETPLNPTGEARNIAFYAEKAHSRGAVLVVDATFAPPPLQDPFAWGADVVMHSGTKYLGGHSDLLMGVLATRDEGLMGGLRRDRGVIGNVVGGMEGWLGVRSLRTLEVRVRKQSEGAGKLVQWLDGEVGEGRGEEKGEGEGKGIEGGVERKAKERTGMVRRVVESVHHASLQKEDLRGDNGEEMEGWLSKQMPHGFGPVFALTMKSEELARRLPSKLRFFAHATSLGGVESLVEWRAMSDASVDPRLVRLSVGIEGWEDLRADLEEGFGRLVEEMESGVWEGEGRDGAEKRLDGEEVDGEVDGERQRN